MAGGDMEGKAIASGANASEAVADLRSAAIAAGATYVAGGLLGILTLVLVDDPSFHARPVGFAAAVAVLGGVALIGRAHLVSIDELFVSNLVGPLLVAVAAFFAGPIISGYVAMLWVWSGTLAFFLFDRRRAVGVVALIGVCYAMVLVFQDANPFAIVRWLITITTIVVTGGIVAWLVRGSAVLRARSEEAEQDAAKVRSELEVERLNRLKSFVSPQVADLLSRDDPILLQPHRREIAVLFVDLRGFTRFASSAEPEDVGAVLEDFYGICLEVAQNRGATIGDMAGDGLMAYFNDPVPCERPAESALATAIEIRNRLNDQQQQWAQRGFLLGHGIGIAYGYATIGMLGASGFVRYGPVGTVVNLASRLCAEAGDGEILIDQRGGTGLAGTELAPIDLADVKGFASPLRAFRWGSGSRDTPDKHRPFAQS